MVGSRSSLVCTAYRTRWLTRVTQLRRTAGHVMACMLDGQTDERSVAHDGNRLLSMLSTACCVELGPERHSFGPMAELRENVYQCMTEREGVRGR